MSEESTSIRAGTITCKKTRKLKILKSLHKLIHACKCTTSNCNEPGCEEMKGLVIHFKVCTKKRECFLCQQLLSLCHFHAKNSKDCEAVHCVVPFCAKIKFKLDLKRGVFPEKSQPSTSEDFEAVTMTTPPVEAMIAPPVEVSTVTPVEVSTAPPIEVSSVPPIEAPAQGSGHDAFQGLEQVEEDLSILPRMATYMGALQTGSRIIEPLGNMPDEILLRRLLHAQNCFYEEERGMARWPCFEAYCGVMKNVIRHISQCHINTECTRLHCESAKFLLTHFWDCKDRSCFLCGPVRVSHTAPSVNDWKSGIFHRARKEVVEYGVTFLVTKWGHYEGIIEPFVEKSEIYAFISTNSKADYCKVIARRLRLFEVVQGAAPGFQVREDDFVRVLEVVFSFDSSFKTPQVQDFMIRNPQFQKVFVERLRRRPHIYHRVSRMDCAQVNV